MNGIHYLQFMIFAHLSTRVPGSKYELNKIITLIHQKIFPNFQLSDSHGMYRHVKDISALLLDFSKQTYLFFIRLLRPFQT